VRRLKRALRTHAETSETVILQSLESLGRSHKAAAIELPSSRSLAIFPQRMVASAIAVHISLVRAAPPRWPRPNSRVTGGHFGKHVSVGCRP